jgi:DNA-binding MarR family transcriptional regulator
MLAARLARSTRTHAASIVRFDEIVAARYLRVRMTATLVRAVQRDFPQIYLACHVDHVRTKSNRHHLSSHDATLLAHLDETRPVAAGALARHLGVASSTLSATLNRLETLGHLVRRARDADGRRIDVFLTAGGDQAMADASVLDRGRVATLLGELSAAERTRAVAGLALLARAARAAQAKAPRRPRW